MKEREGDIWPPDPAGQQRTKKGDAVVVWVVDYKLGIACCSGYSCEKRRRGEENENNFFVGLFYRDEETADLG